MATKVSNFDREYHGLPSEIRLMIWRLLLPFEDIIFDLLTVDEQNDSAASDSQGGKVSLVSQLQQPEYRHVGAMLRLNHETRAEVQELYRNNLVLNLVLVEPKNHEQITGHIASMKQIARTLMIRTSVNHNRGIEDIIHFARGLRSLVLIDLGYHHCTFGFLSRDGFSMCASIQDTTMSKLIEEVATGGLQEVILVCLVRPDRADTAVKRVRMAAYENVDGCFRTLENIRKRKVAHVDRVEWSEEWAVLQTKEVRMDQSYWKELDNAGVDMELFIKAVAPRHVGILVMRKA